MNSVATPIYLALLSITAVVLGLLFVTFYELFTIYHNFLLFKRSVFIVHIEPILRGNFNVCVNFLSKNP